MGVKWAKQCHKPAMTGNGKHSTYKNGDLGMVYGIVLAIAIENGSFISMIYPSKL